MYALSIVNLPFFLHGPELESAIKSRTKQFKDHHEIVTKDNKYAKLIKTNALKDQFAIFISQDYSQDMQLGSPRENQSMYMKRATCVLHGTIIWYLEHKFYLFTGGDITGHCPEVPFYALAKAINLVEDRFGVKIKRVYRRTDKGMF